MKKLKILVVNGFSSGMMIVEEAKRLGFECYHLSTAMEGVPESYLRHNMAKGYDGILTYDEDFEKLLGKCRAYGFDIVMPGTESGVILAEKLADALSLPCNDISLSLERRDKYYMQKRLGDAGVPCIKSALVKSAEEAILWYRANRLKKVVLKPRMDAGGIGLHFCETVEEIARAFNELYGQKSCFGEDVETPDVLIQEFVSGAEIVVNHFSHNGAHELTDIWVYDKEGAVYYHGELINELSPVFCEAAKYTEKALDALGIRYGASHSEIMLTENGPVLIETGARLMGQMMPCTFMREVFGYSIIEKCILSYVSPVDTQNKLVPGYRLSALKYYIMMMRGYEEKKLAAVPAEELLRKCARVVDVRLEELKESMLLLKTTNLVDLPGTFGLMGRDAEQLKTWIRLYRLIEKEHPAMLFRSEEDAPLTEEELELGRQLTDM